MEAKNPIEVKNLKKDFYLFSNKWEQLKSALVGHKNAKVIRSIGPLDLKIAQGEAWGIIGENGAGKSTFLKLVAGIIKPTSGIINVRGRISSILELGIGFHPDLTGRENVLLNASIYGFDKETINDKINEIRSFAEIGDYFDMPVKFYSSGMYMRLAFSLAVNVDPDILLIDEALAVGDGYFVTKCLKKMAEKRDQGTTILFVSHSLYTIESFCHKACWLKDGKIESIGYAKEVINEYEQYLNKNKVHSNNKICKSKQSNSSNNELVKINNIKLCNLFKDTFNFKSTLKVIINFSLYKDIPVYVAFSIDRKDGIYCYATSMKADGLRPITKKGEYCIKLEFEKLLLLEGEYKLVVFIMDQTGIGVLDQKETNFFKIVAQEKQWGICYLPHKWTLSL